MLARHFYLVLLAKVNQGLGQSILPTVEEHGNAIWHRAWIANNLELDLEGQKGEI